MKRSVFASSFLMLFAGWAWGYLPPAPWPNCADSIGCITGFGTPIELSKQKTPFDFFVGCQAACTVKMSVWIHPSKDFPDGGGKDPETITIVCNKSCKFPLVMP